MFDFSAKEVLRLRREYRMQRCLEVIRKGQAYIEGVKKQQLREYHKAYYARNREKLIERQKGYYARKKGQNNDKV